MHVAEMPHIRNLMLNNKVFKFFRQSIPEGKKWTWIHRPEWLEPITSQHLKERRIHTWSDFHYKTYDMNHFDNISQDHGESRDEGSAPPDVPPAEAGAIQVFPDEAAVAPTPKSNV